MHRSCLICHHGSRTRHHAAAAAFAVGLIPLPPPRRRLGAQLRLGLALELGFLIIFLYPITPLFSSHPCSSAHVSDSPAPVILLLRSATFHLLFGAGMSKLGGSSSACWLQLSCTSTHYFTQPMPNLLFWYTLTLTDIHNGLRVYAQIYSRTHTNTLTNTQTYTDTATGMHTDTDAATHTLSLMCI